MSSPVIEIARHYLGTKTGAAVVATWLHGVGLPAPIVNRPAWCAAASIGWHVEANPQTRIPRTGRSATLMRLTDANPMRFKNFTPEDVAWGIATPQAGDYVIFAHNPEVQNFAGHTETVEESRPHQRVATIGGNTTCPGAQGDERNGGCVAEKVRHAGINGFLLMRYVRER